MSYSISTAAIKSSIDITPSSTGRSPADWRRWWAAESIKSGTDWVTLASQHIDALQAALFESSGAAS
jgi:hypothetical protein